MEEQDEGEKSKSKSKLIGLRNRFHMNGQLHDQHQVLGATSGLNGNDSVSHDDRERKRGISSKNGQKEKTTSSIVEERKKESRLYKLFFHRRSAVDAGGSTTPNRDKTNCKKHKETSTRENFPDDDFMSDSAIAIKSGKMERLRNHLPLVEAENKSKEKPLGMVFLTFRDETKRGLLPNEVTSVSTLWALFVRAFPDSLTMNWFDVTRVTLYILDPTTKLYRPLRNLREVRDKSALKIFEQEANEKSKVTWNVIHSNPQLPWRRFESCESSNHSFESQASKENLRSYLSPQLNSQQMNRNGLLRSAPPLHEKYLYQRDDGIYKSLHLRKDQVIQSVVRQESMKSSTSNNSDISQATVVRSPLHCNADVGSLGRQRSISEKTSLNAAEMKKKMDELRRQSRLLSEELNELKRLQKIQVSVMKDSILEATSKCEELISSLHKEVAKNSGRQVIEIQKSGYADDVCLVEAKLRGVELSISDLKNGIITRIDPIRIYEINKMANLLSNVAKLLTELRGRLQALQKCLKPLMVAEIGAIMDDENFVKSEPSRLEGLLNRCKHLAAILNTLKRMVMSHSNSNIAKSENSLPPPNLCNTQNPISVQLGTDGLSKPYSLSDLKSISEKSQSQQQQISTQHSSFIASHSSDSLESVKCSGNQVSDQFYRKMLYPRHQMDSEAYIFLMHNLQRLYTGLIESNQSLSSQSLARGGMPGVSTLSPVIQGTQSAPSTPMMIGARTLGGPLSSSFLLRNVYKDSESSSSCSSLRTSDTTDLKQMNDCISCNLTPIPDHVAEKQWQNHFLQPEHLVFGNHIRTDLLNELALNSHSDRETRRNHFESVSDTEDFTKCNRSSISLNNPLKISESSHSTTKYGSLYSDLYKMLDDNLNKQRQLEQSPSSCPHCSEESEEIKGGGKVHKSDCPYQVHEAILRFSQTANSNADLEMGLCAKLSRAHLQEKLKMRQDQQKKQELSKVISDNNHIKTKNQMMAQPPPYSASYPPPQPPPQAPYVQYSTTHVTTSQPVSTITIIRANGCPKCTIGTIVESFTLPGICCAFFFFPIGVFFCFIWKRRSCNNCGAEYC